MKDIFSNLKTNILCKRTRNNMLSSYLSNQYFGFDNNAHASSCIKCQVSGKRYKAFKEELDNEFKKEVEVPTDFASKVMSSFCLLYTSPSPRDLSTSRMPSSA